MGDNTSIAKKNTKNQKERSFPLKKIQNKNKIIYYIYIIHDRDK